MTVAERALYQQIHPVKLQTDWSTAMLAAYALWHHHLASGLLVGLVPPILVSAVFLAGAGDLERYKHSRLGRYVAESMTSAVQAVRLLGGVSCWVAAWHHSVLGMTAALLVVLGAWAWGAVWPRQTRRDPPR